MSYEHTQRGWAVRIATLLGAVGMVAGVAFSPEELPRGLYTVLLLVAAAIALVGWSFSVLTVRVGAGELLWHFGSGWPSWSTPLERIADVEVTRTTFWEGWGVHRTRRGWLYNVAGQDAVLVKRSDGTAVMLGSDEPRKLKNALQDAIRTAASDPRKARR
jgi:hypothetical protein